MGCGHGAALVLGRSTGAGGDEIGHVRIGNFWFCELCRERNLDAPQAFRHLVSQFMGSKLRGPFNRDARIAAGFDPLELDRLEKEF